MTSGKAFFVFTEGQVATIDFVPLWADTIDMPEFKNSSALVHKRIQKMEETDCHSDSLLLHSLYKSINSDPAEKMLAALLIDSGAVQAVVLENSRVLYKFGPAFITTKDLFHFYQQKKGKAFIRLGGFVILGEKLELYSFEIADSLSRFVILALFPTFREISAITFQKAGNLLMHYFAHRKDENLPEVKKLFSATEEKMNADYKNANSISSIAILRLQNLKSYIELTGPHRSKEIFGDIKKHIVTYLDGKSEQVYLIDERTVVILMSGIPRAKAKSILEEMFIHVGNLIIDYNLFVYDISQLGTSDDLFQEIHRISQQK